MMIRYSFILFTAAILQYTVVKKIYETQFKMQIKYCITH